MRVRSLGLGKYICACVLAVFVVSVGGCKRGSQVLWQAYEARFIDAQGRVIDPQGADRTTSEGQAYAMFFSVVGNDRSEFQKLLNWTQKNMASGDLGTHLPGWQWGHNAAGEWKLLDANSASDADVWMAYALVEGGRLWHNNYYSNLGRLMIGQIERKEVVNLPGFGPMLLPGPVGFVHDNGQGAQSFVLNPSYVPLPVIEGLAKVDPDGPWQMVALNLPKLLRQSAVRGFAMDWVKYTPGNGFTPTVPQPGNDELSPMGSYDAIRVYLWAGMIAEGDPLRAEVLQSLQGMRTYLSDHAAPPEKVNSVGFAQPREGPVGFSGALIPYLRAVGEAQAGARQTVRMGEGRDPNSGLYGANKTYYDQNLIMFATGFLDHRFAFEPTGELHVEWKGE